MAGPNEELELYLKKSRKDKLMCKDAADPYRCLFDSNALFSFCSLPQSAHR